MKNNEDHAKENIDLNRINWGNIGIDMQMCTFGSTIYGGEY